MCDLNKLTPGPGTWETQRILALIMMHINVIYHLKYCLKIAMQILQHT